MKILIAKLGATGDVVRTTTLLKRLPGMVTWITAVKNKVFLQGLAHDIRVLSWEERDQALDSAYDLTINLEDTADVAQFAKTLRSKQTFGAYSDCDGSIRYTDDSRRWFDLSLISIYGREKADSLKLQNRQTYQELIFDGLGFKFAGEKYTLPSPPDTGLSGDVAIAAEAGPVWPMKKWAFYPELKKSLEDQGLTVNILPQRASLLEHLGDVKNHKCLVGGDSLPMHLALGTDTRCVSIFTCTSPWEIHDYGIQTKLISPLLDEFFYKRGFELRATNTVPLEAVSAAVREQLRASN